MRIRNNSLVHILLKILFGFNFILLLGEPKFSIFGILFYIINLLSFWMNATILMNFIKYSK